MAELRWTNQAVDVVPEFKSEEIREVILGSYRIIYRVKDDIAEVLTIHHSAQLLSMDFIDKQL
ncbi:MAG: type II toxin-antitoxin system RelE/ParE family toxin [Lentisphaeraceae bacterium]|nr:type II toxin-antitoxin system RelE/ParE family toxin [Lentisphaeraceae bacterium]